MAQQSEIYDNKNFICSICIDKIIEQNKTFIDIFFIFLFFWKKNFFFHYLILLLGSESEISIEFVLITTITNMIESIRMCHHNFRLLPDHDYSQLAEKQAPVFFPTYIQSSPTINYLFTLYICLRNHCIVSFHFIPHWWRLFPIDFFFPVI